jgi:rhamnosyltransferase
MIVSSPLREYYQTKNRLYLIKQDYTPLNNKLVLFFGVTIRPILHLLLLDERTKRVKYIYKGIKDYFHGYMGEYGNNN